LEDNHSPQPNESRNDGEENLADLFSGRAKPALLSTKEPALRLLKERYSETFAITPGVREEFSHLFLIKFGLWGLVKTFTPTDLRKLKEGSTVDKALLLIRGAMEGKDDSLLAELDRSVKNALERIRAKREKMSSFKIQ
jgi:hypothetical protein